MNIRSAVLVLLLSDMHSEANWRYFFATLCRERAKNVHVQSFYDR
jgi:hypothetical protein